MAGERAPRRRAHSGWVCRALVAGCVASARPDAVPRPHLFAGQCRSVLVQHRLHRDVLWFDLLSDADVGVHAGAGWAGADARTIDGGAAGANCREVGGALWPSPAAHSWWS